MNEIYLKESGLLVYKGETVEANPLMFLGYRLVLEDTCTVRNVFRMLEKYPLLAQLNPFLPVFIDQYRLAPKKNCIYADIDAIKLVKTIEMIGFPGEPKIEIYLSLQGVSGNKTCDIRSVWLENLLDMSIRLGKLNHMVFGDRIDTFQFDTVFTLFEFIDGIAWQLSFHNMPAECRIAF